MIDWLKRQGDNIPTSSILYRTFSTTEASSEKAEQMLEAWRNNVTSLEPKTEKLFEIKHYNKKPKQIQKLYRPDFKLNKTTFLNVDGLYWHSDAVQEDKNYHFNIRKHFEDNGLRLFQFREDEIRDKSQIVKSIVNNTLGKTSNRIQARKCDIRNVSQKEVNGFFGENHLMGTIYAKHIGLYFNDTLSSILSYKIYKNVCKIERFCSLLNTNVIGGFSKLISFLEKIT